MQPLISAHQRKLAERNRKAKALYDKLSAKPGAMKTACEATVMAKYGIKSRATIWRIVRKEPPR